MSQIMQDDECLEKALLAAAEGGYADIVKLALNKNVNMECYGEDKRTSLELALEYNYLPTVEVLLEGGVKTKPDHLFIPIRNGNLDMCRLLLKHKVNPNCHVNAIRKLTPLHYAAKHDDLEICALLISNGALLVNDYNGHTAVQLATHRSVVAFLREKQAMYEKTFRRELTAAKLRQVKQMDDSKTPKSEKSKKSKKSKKPNPGKTK